jgi:hypothetical protein
MPAREAWFQQGPADGALLAVETAVDGGLPDVVTLTATGMYVGVSDEPDPAVGHVYLRMDDPDDTPSTATAAPAATRCSPAAVTRSASVSAAADGKSFALAHYGTAAHRYEESDDD